MAQNVLSRVALHCIRFYRMHLSKRKGYSCAHGYLHKRGTCSQFGLRAFKKHGPLLAIRALKRRLRECGDAYETLTAQMSKKEFAAHCEKRGFLEPPGKKILSWIRKKLGWKK